MVIRRAMTEREWAEKKMQKVSIGTTLGGALIVTGLTIAGFFTYGLTWIPAIIIGKSSVNKRRKKFYQEHKEELLEGYKEYKEKFLKREELRAQGIPNCPHCTSEKVEVFTQISNSFSGRYEYGKPKMVCKVCGHTFDPGT